MTLSQLSLITLSALLLVGCGEDPVPKNATTSLSLNAEGTQAVSLNIPGVGNQADIAELKTDANGAISGSIERGNIPAAPGNTNNASANGIPRPLILDGVISNRFSNIPQGPAGAEILNAEFYPIGWSADGKFAYAVEPPSEASDSYFLNVYIQDLVTDKIVWQDKYRSVPEVSTAIQSFAEYWQVNQAAMEARLNKFAIKKNSDHKLFAGSISNQSDRLDYVVKKTLKGQPDFGNLAMVTEYQVVVSSDSFGTKTVHKEQYKKPIDVLDVDVVGYLRGEDTRRVALLVAGVRRGWEGPPHVTWFKVVGTNLKSGFKKTPN